MQIHVVHHLEPLVLERIGDALNLLRTMMVDITKLTTDVTALTAAIAQVDTDLANLRSQIAALQAQLASGAGVTQAQIDALDASVAAAVTNLNTQVGQDTPPAPTPPAGT